MPRVNTNLQLLTGNNLIIILHGLSCLGIIWIGVIEMDDRSSVRRIFWFFWVRFLEDFTDSCGCVVEHT